LIAAVSKKALSARDNVYRDIKNHWFSLENVIDNVQAKKKFLKCHQKVTPKSVIYSKSTQATFLEVFKLRKECFAVITAATLFALLDAYAGFPTEIQKIEISETQYRKAFDSCLTAWKTHNSGTTFFSSSSSLFFPLFSLSFFFFYISLISHFSFLISHFSFLISHFSFYFLSKIN